MNHFSKLNSFRDMNFRKWSIINNHEDYQFHTNSSVIDHFWKFISRKLLGFEKWFTIHFLPRWHRKSVCIFISILYTFGEKFACWRFKEVFWWPHFRLPGYSTISRSAQFSFFLGYKIRQFRNFILFVVIFGILKQFIKQITNKQWIIISNGISCRSFGHNLVFLPQDLILWYEPSS